MIKKLFVRSGDHWVGQKRLIFKRGDSYKWCQSCLRALKCKKKNFCSNSYILGTKWPRHQKCVLNWRFLQESKFEPIFEHVTLSWSSGEKEKSWGLICPPPPGVIRSKKCQVLWVNFQLLLHSPSLVNELFCSDNYFFYKFGLLQQFLCIFSWE